MDWKMIIGGKSVDASDGAVLKNYNPYTGEQATAAEREQSLTDMLTLALEIA